MTIDFVPCDPANVLNQCTKHRAPDTVDSRHSYLGALDQGRGRHSDGWRFTIIDRPQLTRTFNDVTFVLWPIAKPYIRHRSNCSRRAPALTTQFSLTALNHQPSERKLCAHPARHPIATRTVIDGVAGLDSISQQTETLPIGDAWSGLFTCGYAQPVSFECWELAVIDRLTRHFLSFTSCETDVIEKYANGDLFGGNVYRLDVFPRVTARRPMVRAVQQQSVGVRR